MVVRILVSPLVALLVALHGVPLAALAPLFHCAQESEAGTVKEGDHCERKPIRKEAPCPHHRRGSGGGSADGAPAIHSAACSCGHSAVASRAIGDPLLRPRAAGVAVYEPSRVVSAAPVSGDGAIPAAPPSPPPRGLLS